MKNSKKFPSPFTRGFTLIEMLVVIAIIIILTGIIVTNMSGAKEKARDTKRISDLGNIQLALELYFDRCNQYPYTTTNGDSKDTMDFDDVSCPKEKPGANGDKYMMSDFISSLPRPSPEAGQTDYGYVTNTERTNYWLQADLETESEVVKDSVLLDDSADWIDRGNPFMCSRGPEDKTYCVGPK